MPHPHDETPLSELLLKKHYDIDSLESEIRADRYCARLLKHFHQWLLRDMQIEALEAGRLASGADYFLREFLIGARRQNIFSATSEQLRQFGGNWYIINNLEPNNRELKPMLKGAACFYNYCVIQDKFNSDAAKDIESVAQDHTYFESRIEDFHQLQNNGYSAWDQACPLK